MFNVQEAKNEILYENTSITINKVEFDKFGNFPLQK